MVKRFDIGALKKPEKTPQGFLKVDALLTRTGIFEYRKPGGGARRELRRDSDVFNSVSLGSFAMAPVTDDHPAEMLSPANASAYTRGYLGEAIRRDGDYVRASMLVTDAALIAKMEAGKKQVSCGYVCDLDETPGEFNGQKYDAVQINIRGNHVAVVDTGRAGETCAVRMDAADAFAGTCKETCKETDRMDEKEFQAKLDVETAKLRAELAKAEIRADIADAEIKKERAARTDAAEKFSASVAARVSLEDTARSVLGTEHKFDATKSDSDVALACIEKLGVKISDAVRKDAVGALAIALQMRASSAVAEVRVASEEASRVDASTERKSEKVLKDTKARLADAWKEKK